MLGYGTKSNFLVMLVHKTFTMSLVDINKNSTSDIRDLSITLRLCHENRCQIPRLLQQIECYK